MADDIGQGDTLNTTASSADYERAVEHATDALEVFFKCQEPVTPGLQRWWLEDVVRRVIDAAGPYLIGLGRDLEARSVELTDLERGRRGFVVPHPTNPETGTVQWVPDAQDADCALGKVDTVTALRRLSEELVRLARSIDTSDTYDDGRADGLFAASDLADSMAQQIEMPGQDGPHYDPGEDHPEPTPQDAHIDGVVASEERT